MEQREEKSENGGEIICHVPVTWSNDDARCAITEFVCSSLGGSLLLSNFTGVWRGIVSCAARGSPIVKLT